MNDGSATRGFSLKDKLFNSEKVAYLAGLFGFDASFHDKVVARFPELELRQRISWIAEVMAEHLPQDYTAAASKISLALPPPLDPNLRDDDFGDFIFSPLSEYVVQNGMSEPHVEISLDLLHQLTQRFSVEYAIRHFLNVWPAQTVAALDQWANDENYHVRRLVSEGTRPKLPWGIKIDFAYQDALSYLTTLHADPTRFVTRSVANHLNDISKIDPDLVVDTLKSWQSRGAQSPKELDWMTRHALRGLVKNGHFGALQLLGYRESPQIEITGLSFPKKVTIGEVGELNFTVSAKREENLLIDYVIDFVKANGTTAPKVYKVKTVKLKAGQTITITKKHRFVKGATTFTHYPGVHTIWPQINGNKYVHQDFDLCD